VARHIFQACPVWIYTQSNITQAKLVIFQSFVAKCCKMRIIKPCEVCRFSVILMLFQAVVK
jgi:hypothetical protein